MTRVAVFIDYQNVYMRGREVFASPGAPFVEGQVNPLRLGKLRTERGRSEDPKRLLAAVHIFRGEPSSAHAPKAQAACQRQVQHWASLESVRPVTRPLQYRVMGFQDGVERVEVAAWKPAQGYARRLSLPGMWCHYLERGDYELLADRTDYTRASTGR